MKNEWTGEEEWKWYRMKIDLILLCNNENCVQLLWVKNTLTTTIYKLWCRWEWEIMLIYAYNIFILLFYQKIWQHFFFKWALSILLTLCQCAPCTHLPSDKSPIWLYIFAIHKLCILRFLCVIFILNRCYYSLRINI